MIVQENMSMIVMLCNLKENGKVIKLVIRLNVNNTGQRLSVLICYVEM